MCKYLRFNCGPQCESWAEMTSTTDARILEFGMLEGRLVRHTLYTQTVDNRV